MPLMDIPDNFPFSAEQAAMISCCHRETILEHTKPSKKGTRYYLQARRNTPNGPVKIMAKDLADYLKRTQLGYLPGNENE